MNWWRSVRESVLCYAGVVFALIAVIGFIVAISMASAENGYRKGWCESRGGYHISDGLCDINGAVVKVDERKD